MAKRISNTTDIVDAWARLDALIEHEQGAKVALDAMFDAHGEVALSPSMEGRGRLIQLTIGGPAAPVLYAASEAAAEAQKQQARLGTLLLATLRSKGDQFDSWLAKN